MGESLNQPSRVKEEGSMDCKLLLQGNKGRYVYCFVCTLRIRIG